MVLGIGIEKPADHSLILRAVFARLFLEEFDASFAQADRDLHPFFSEYKIFRRREKVRNHLEISEGFVCVPNFLAHILASLYASSRLQRSESPRRDR